MKKKVIWLSLSFMLVAAMLLASCAKSTTSTSTSTTKTTITTTTTTTTKTTTTPISVTTTTTAAGNWWDSLPKPQYGGTLNLRSAADLTLWDPYYAAGQAGIVTSWLEPLFSYDWTVNPTIFNYKLAFTPPDYNTGQLAKSWEMPDKNTVIVHLRQGIHWQNLAPANGRELVADDVAWNYNRIYGLGGYGFTTPAPPSATSAIKQLLDITSVTAGPDNYTVTFKFKGDSQESILEGVLGQYPKTVCPDVVKQYGNANDWHHALGTGPFILQDFVSGASATLVRNPNYWGYDERYPQNQLPYVSAIHWVIVSDNATALAGLRTGKIDVLDALDNVTEQNLSKTNPELLKTANYGYAGNDIDVNNAVAPLSNVKVRQALQMAINLPEIAQSYYNGLVDPSPLALTSALLYPAYGWPYSQWPQTLKDEYAFNPTTAKQLLATAGVASGYAIPVLADNTADLNLLQLVKGYWANIGITMNIQTVDHASFLGTAFSHKIAGMAYKTPSSLGLGYSPILQVQNFQTDMLFNWEMVSDPAYDAFVSDALAVTSTVDDIKKDLLGANKLTVQGHYCISLLMPVNWGIYQPWLHGYDAQFDAISGALTCGESNYFFLARYWIDTKLKTSMGH